MRTPRHCLPKVVQQRGLETCCQRELQSVFELTNASPVSAERFMAPHSSSPMSEVTRKLKYSRSSVSPLSATMAETPASKTPKEDEEPKDLTGVSEKQEEGRRKQTPGVPGVEEGLPHLSKPEKAAWKSECESGGEEEREREEEDGIERSSKCHPADPALSTLALKKTDGNVGSIAAELQNATQASMKHWGASENTVVGENSLGNGSAAENPLIVSAEAHIVVEDENRGRVVSYESDESDEEIVVDDSEPEDDTLGQQQLPPKEMVTIGTQTQSKQREIRKRCKRKKYVSSCRPCALQGLNTPERCIGRIQVF